MSSSAAASLKADLLLVLVTLLAAVSWIFSKEAVLLMPPLLFMALRFLLAGLLLALLGWRQIRALNVRQIRRATRVGMVFGFGMSCWIMGLHAGGHLGEGAFLTNLGVVLVPLLAALLFGERAPLSTWLALPVAGAGLALLFLQHGLRPAPGQLFYVLAAGTFALFYILNTRAANERPGAPGGRGDKVPPLALTAIVLTVVGLLSALLSFGSEPWQPTIDSFGPVLAGWVVASAVIGSAARFLIQTYAQSLSAHSHGVVIMVVEPVWTALLSAAWFGETMTGMQLAGCGLIFAALLISRAAAVGQLVRSALRQDVPS